MFDDQGRIREAQSEMFKKGDESSLDLMGEGKSDMSQILMLLHYEEYRRISTRTRKKHLRRV